MAAKHAIGRSFEAIAYNARQVIDDEDKIEGFSRRFDESARTTPEKAAQTIIKGLRKNKERVLIGTDAWFFDRLTRFFPNWALRTFAKMGKRYDEGGRLL